MAQIDYDAQIALIWGGAYDCVGLLPLLSDASNVVVGDNPPYTPTDFLMYYPNFGGVPLTVAVALTEGDAEIDGFTVPTGAAIAVGNFVIGQGIPSGTTVTNYTPAAGMTPASMTLSNAPTITATPVTLSIFVAPLVPAVVIALFVATAQGSIFQARWQELWLVAMGLYIAHYCTLWAKAQGNPASTVGQLVTASLAFGILTSKSADGLSAGYSVLSGLEDWGSYQLTLYGQEFATWAKVMGSGSALVW